MKTKDAEKTNMLSTNTTLEKGNNSKSEVCIKYICLIILNSKAFTSFCKMKIVNKHVVQEEHAKSSKDA
jgi:hypothetical protein